MRFTDWEMGYNAAIDAMQDGAIPTKKEVEEDRVIIVTGGGLFNDISQYIKVLKQSEVIHLNYFCHEKIRAPATHLDNQPFIQQKMQGKRKVY